MITIGYTENIISQYIAKQFNLGISDSNLKFIDNCFFENLLISYGVLRGSFEKIKQSKNFFYVDHGYFSKMKRVFFTDNKTGNKISSLPAPGSKNFDNSYFRVCYNSFFHSGLTENFNKDRFSKLNITIKKREKKGEKILLIPPDPIIAQKIHGITNWETNTKSILTKYTDREIVTSFKHDKKKANDYFNETFAVVTCYSNAGIEAMLNGIPCIFTHKDRKNFDLRSIEQIEFNEQILYNLAHYQWNIKEIQSGEAWESMKKIWLKNII